MLDGDHNSVLAVVGSLLGGVGFWNYLSSKRKTDHEQQKEYLQSLIAQVTNLSAKVEVLIKDKEELLREIAELKADLASANSELSSMRIYLVNRDR